MRVPVLPPSTSRRGLLGLAGLSLATPLRAADFPTRPIRIVVPFAPGGSLDILARIYARHMGESLGWQMVVENRSGGGGIIGADLVAKARPDGHTLLISSDPLTLAPSLVANLPFDPIRDLQPLGIIARLSQVLAVHPDFPARDFAGFLAMARAQPQSVIVGHTGPGSAGHLTAALLAQQGVQLSLVPYRGGGPAAQDMVAGTLGAGIITLPSALPFLRERRLRPLAVTSPRRSLFAPEVPAMAEALPGVELDSWQGLFLPAGTPPEIAGPLHAAITATTRLPVVHEWLLGQAFEPVVGLPEELGALMAREVPRWRGVIQAVGL
jgi:tripartite-type tricarboxylate transporter receptor subunit TctC